MILESEQNARKIVQTVMQDDEKLVWASSPRLRLVLFSEVPLSVLGAGLFALFLFAGGFLNLDPSFGWKYQYSPEIQQNANIFCLVLSVLCCIAWPIFSIWIARAEGVYGVTTKRVLLVERKRREVWVREARTVSSVSIISDKNGQGSVCIADDYASSSMKFNYLEHAATIASLVAETFAIPFDVVTSNPTVAAETVSISKELLGYVYLPVGEKRGLMAVCTSIALWLGYLLFIWVWLGSIEGTIGHSWLLQVILIFLSVAITIGLVLRLKKSVKR
ncbi:hypothetical protein BH10CYA1_BH10CYA1_00450 [soil metagenome]